MMIIKLYILIRNFIKHQAKVTHETKFSMDICTYHSQCKISNVKHYLSVGNQHLQHVVLENFGMKRGTYIEETLRTNITFSPPGRINISLEAEFAMRYYSFERNQILFVHIKATAGLKYVLLDQVVRVKAYMIVKTSKIAMFTSMVCLSTQLSFIPRSFHVYFQKKRQQKKLQKMRYFLEALNATL